MMVPRFASDSLVACVDSGSDSEETESYSTEVEQITASEVSLEFEHNDKNLKSPPGQANQQIVELRGVRFVMERKRMPEVNAGKAEVDELKEKYSLMEKRLENANAKVHTLQQHISAQKHISAANKARADLIEVLLQQTKQAKAVFVDELDGLFLVCQNLRKTKVAYQLRITRSEISPTSMSRSLNLSPKKSDSYVKAGDVQKKRRLKLCSKSPLFISSSSENMTAMTHSTERASHCSYL